MRRYIESEIPENYAHLRFPAEKVREIIERTRSNATTPVPSKKKYKRKPKHKGWS